MPGHVCEFEEDVPEVGGELLGVSVRSGAGLGQIPRLADLIRQKAEEIASGKAQAASSEAVGGGAAR